MLPPLTQSERKDTKDLCDKISLERDAIQKKLCDIAKSTPVFDSLLRVESPEDACHALGQLFKPGVKPVIMFFGHNNSGKATLVHGLCSLLGTRVTFITKFHKPEDVYIQPDSLVVILEAKNDFPTLSFMKEIREENIMGIIACGTEYPSELDDCDCVQVIKMLSPLDECEKNPAKDLLRALRYEKKAVFDKLKLNTASC